MSNSTPGAGVSTRQSDWNIQHVVESYVVNSKLSRRQTAFLAQELERMCHEKTDYTANWPAPPMEIQIELEGDDYKNCSWAHLACHVLARLDVETDRLYPDEAPIECLNAEPVWITPEREAELKVMEEEWNALPKEEQQRRILEMANRI